MSTLMMMGMEFGKLASGGGGGGGSPTITITGNKNADNTFGSVGGAVLPTATLAVGSYNPATDDLFVFAASTNGGAASTTMQAAGMASAVAGTEINADGVTGVWVVPRGSGVTVTGGNISLAWSISGFSVGGYGMVVGYVHGATSGTPTSHQTLPFTNFSDPLQMTAACVVPSSGVGAAFYYNSSSSDNPISTWFGVTKVSAAEGTNATGNNTETSGGTQTTPGSYTVGVRLLGGPGPTAGSMAFVAFA